jgi:hypothetical protein
LEESSVGLIILEEKQMAISIEWDITHVSVVDVDNLKNVAVQVCFDVKGSDGKLQGFTQSDVMLGETDPAKFTAIEKVTKEQMVAWTKAALGGRVKEFEDRVIEQIERQRIPQPRPFIPTWAKKNEQ